eukprot:m.306599 g.306599  ORF g.306599 m.306599 type:complete len:600 (+) comp41387_c0_seq1:60-1859(+)
MSFSLGNVFAVLPQASRGTPFVLNGDPKGKNFLYANANSVIIRDVKNPEIAETYCEHKVQATVASYSPTGYYIASTDVSGMVRIWDTTQKEHLLKYEYQVFAGPIRDLSWGPESKRIAVGGAGRDTFARAFLWDSGSSIGEITGISKTVNSVALKPTRPYRLVTGSEDKSASFFAGPPFKFQKTLKEHTQFVNSVRYAPDGSLFCTGGHDGMAFLYDGKTGDLVGQLGEGKSHAGGIYAMAWSPDSKRVITASGDKTCKIWDAETRSAVTEFKMGTTVDDMQVGVLWQNDDVLSLSVSGYINYLDLDNPSKPKRIIKGHSKPVTSAVYYPPKNTIYSGSFDGRIIHWNASNGEMDELSGSNKPKSVVQFALHGDQIAYCTVEDTVCITNPESNEYCSTVMKVDSTPTGIGAGKDIIVTSCVNHVVLIRGGQVVCSKSVSFDPLCAAVSPSQQEVAVGGKDEKVHVFAVDGDNLVEKIVKGVRGQVNCLVYSPDGNLLVAGTSLRMVIPLNPQTLEMEHDNWCNHSGRVSSVAFSPNSRYVASGSLDNHIFIWDREHPTKRIKIDRAHPLSNIPAIQWVDDNTIVSAGSDGCLRFFKIQF